MMSNVLYTYGEVSHLTLLSQKVIETFIFVFLVSKYTVMQVFIQQQYKLEILTN
jgi:hypothetical protein